MPATNYVQAYQEAAAYFKHLAKLSNERFYKIEADSKKFSHGIVYSAYKDEAKTELKAPPLYIDLEYWDAGNFDTFE